MNTFLSKYFFYYPITMLKGEFVSKYLKEYRRFQWFSSEKIIEFQLFSLNNIINYSIKNNQFYKNLYRQFGLATKYNKIPIESLKDIKELPTISKQDLIDSGELITNHAFLSSQKTTGGSTGEPVSLCKSPSALARERAATLRAFEWAGLDIGAPQLRFWGIPHTNSARVKARIADLATNRLRISAFEITQESLVTYYKKFIKFNPQYIYGYVSAIEQFAIFVSENKLVLPDRLKAVITTAEILTEGIRSTIQNAFKVRVYNEYGCGEVGAIAHECQHGSMHIMADNVFLEVDKNSDGNHAGKLIVTDLHNRATPLIRYRLGDFGILTSKQCNCGRGLPVLQNIYGRAYDFIRTPSGRKIHPESLIYVFEDLQKNNKFFRQFQAIQKSLYHIDVRVIPYDGFSKEIEKNLINRLKKNIDIDMNFNIIKVDKIERERSGKMRVVKSMLENT